MSETTTPEAETTTVDKTVHHQADTDGINLMQGESVLQNRRPGWVLWWKQILFGAFVVLIGLSSESLLGGIILGGAIFGYVVIARMSSRYIVTDERIKAKVGLLSKITREYRIPDVQSLTTSQPIVYRLLDHGSITIRTASNDEITWHGVPDYKDVTNSIREQQRKYE